LRDKEGDLVDSKLNDQQRDEILRLLKQTNQTYNNIGNQFGVSRQFIWQICKSKKIKRPEGVVIENHRIDRCNVCQKVMGRGSINWLGTTRQLARELNVSYATLVPHLVILRRHELVPKDFCFFRSEKVVDALKAYQASSEGTSARAIGIQKGVANFTGILWRARQRGVHIERR
jgi:DNA-binding transcriptional ArsR family regulator